MKNVGDILYFGYWLQNNFVKSKKEFLNLMQTDRNQILENIFNNENELSVFEFGVANGYLPNRLKDFYSSQIKNYTGFDLFTGLPNSWKNLPKNHFTNSGKIPEINNPKFKFVIGDVVTTVNSKLIQSSQYSGKKVFYFDLDLYEPSVHCFKEISDSLTSGDYLYFDEAFDSDEMRLIQNYIIDKSDDRFRLIAFTPTSILFQVK